MCRGRWVSFVVAVALAVLCIAPGSWVARAQDKAAAPDLAGKPPAPEKTAEEPSTPPADTPADKPSDKPSGKSDASATKDQDADKPKSEPRTPRRSSRTPASKSAESKSAENKSAESQSAASKSSDKKSSETEEAESVVRLLELSGLYVDQVQPMSFDASSLLLGGESLKQKSFYRLCKYLEDLGNEKEVAHVVFDLSDAGLDMNPAQLDELARRLEKLKATGKELYAWLENPSNVHLSLAASCDHVALADFGGVDMPSSSMQSMFYRDAMEMFGVHASVVRAGDFKGAVEPFLQHQMSDHLRQHYTDMLSSINDAQVDRIARGRALTVAQVRELQKMRLLLPEQALAKGLVDRLAPYGAMKETINDMIGESLEWTKPKAAPKREMSMFELMGRLMSGDKKSAAKAKEATVAVLHLSGAIEDGKKASPGAIVSGPMIKAIEELADDELVKAVVVRINSPGGSATASEAIRRALSDLAKKKPTVVSMGEMAASGGYWISCIDQPVYAEKGTVTGSIGVFSLKISMGSLFRRIGVHVESIALDDAAKWDAIDRPWSEHDMKLMQGFVDDVYSKFLKLVSKSRDLPLEELEDLAGGRVWSGTQAKQHKLVDEIGGLDDCLAAVAKKAKLEKYEVIHRPVIKTGLDLLELFGEEDPSDIELSNLLSSSTMQTLTRQGLDIGVIQVLLHSALNRTHAVPQVWALCPNDLRVR